MILMIIFRLDYEWFFLVINISIKTLKLTKKNTTNKELLPIYHFGKIIVQWKVSRFFIL